MAGPREGAEDTPSSSCSLQSPVTQLLVAPGREREGGGGGGGGVGGRGGGGKRKKLQLKKLTTPHNNISQRMYYICNCI